jgi:hypothetical protein
MDSGVTFLMTPLPGQRIVDGKDPDDWEDGSVLALRKGGDEVLFASWEVENPKGMTWIPVGEFSPDPESVQPPNLEREEEHLEPPADETGASERPSAAGPFGRGSGSLRRRPGVE